MAKNGKWVGKGGSCADLGAQGHFVGDGLWVGGVRGYPGGGGGRGEGEETGGAEGDV